MSDIKSRNSPVLSTVTSMKPNYESTKARKRHAKLSTHGPGPTRTKNGNQQQNRLARSQLEHILATNPAAIFLERPLHDGSELSSIYVSRSVTSLLGFEAENFVGESGTRFWQSRVHPDDLQRYHVKSLSFGQKGTTRLSLGFYTKMALTAGYAKNKK